MIVALAACLLIGANDVPYWDTFNSVCGSRAVDRAAQCRQESGFKPAAKSWVGAEGLMQAMPQSWQWYKDMGVVPKDSVPTDPYWSIVAGHWHMRFLETRLRSWTAALACYNWGRLSRVHKAEIQADLMGFPSRDWHKFIKLPEETSGYIDRIPRVHVPWVKARKGE